MKDFHHSHSLSVAEELFEYRYIEKKKLRICIFITILVMIIEVIGGFLTHSLALISDAGHMFTHFFALIISYAAIVCAGIKSCHHRTFGFYRAEILAALFNSLFIFGVTFWIIFEGVKRLIRPEPVLSQEMFLIAVLGLIVNIITIRILKGSTQDLNIRGAFIHMLADLLSSVVIVIGAIVIYFTGLNVIDPLLSIGIAIVILVWGFGLFKDSVNILLEAAPKGINSEGVSKVLLDEFPKIEEIVDMRLWTITSSMHFITLHIRVKPQLTRQEEKELIADIKHLIKKHFNIEYAPIEIL